MPNTPHEVLHAIYRERPQLLGSAWARAFRVPFPERCQVMELDTDVSESTAIDRKVDTLLKLTGGAGEHIVIVEAQGACDGGKRVSWPYYIAYVHNKYGLPVTLLVTCHDVRVARWAREPIHIGLDGCPSMTVRPFVFGPDNIPAITAVPEAATDVDLAVLSALTHRTSPQAGDILKVLAEALDTVDITTAERLAELTESGLGDTPAQRLWKDLMKAEAFRYQSELHREWNAEGRAEGAARSLLRILAARGIDVPEDGRRRILACTDEDTLARWLDQAVTVTRIEDLD